MTRRECILATVKDMVSDFLYYRRKEDTELPVGAIEEAIKEQEISETDIVNAFARELREGLER